MGNIVIHRENGVKYKIHTRRKGINGNAHFLFIQQFFASGFQLSASMHRQAI